VVACPQVRSGPCSETLARVTAAVHELAAYPKPLARRHDIRLDAGRDFGASVRRGSNAMPSADLLE
jgi:hypothetical protein